MLLSMPPIYTTFIHKSTVV